MFSRGYTCVPIYDTLGEDIVQYEVNHADISIMFVEAGKLALRLLRAAGLARVGALRAARHARDVGLLARALGAVARRRLAPDGARGRPHPHPLPQTLFSSQIETLAQTLACSSHAVPTPDS